MYTIGQVIYGTPCYNIGEIDEEELEKLGIETRYHGNSSEKPAFCGLSVCKIDETEHVNLTDLMAKLQRQITPAQAAEVEAKVKKLPRNVGPKKVGFWIIWCSS